VRKKLGSLPARRIMLDVAEGYDNLAEGAEARIVATTGKGDARST